MAAPAPAPRPPIVLMPDVEPARFSLLAELLVSGADVSRMQVDESGRPLGERYLPPGALAGVELRMVRCPYRDARLGRPMNVSALAPIARGWSQVLSLVGALRAAYAERRSVRSLSLADVWFLGRIATAFPAYLARNAARPLAAIPLPVASAFKPSIGLHMAAERAFLLGEDASSAANRERLTAVIHGTRALLSPDAACPVSPRQLEEFLDAALSGAGPEPAAELAAAFAPLERAVAYGLAVASLELAKFAYVLEFEADLAPLIAAGALPRRRFGPVRSIRGLPVAEGAVPAVHSRLRQLAAGLGLRLPARCEPAGEGATLDEVARRREARAAEWLPALSALQVAVLEALGWEGVRQAPLLPEDLPRMAAYVSRGWEYPVLASRYDPSAWPEARGRPS
jgi:hypothetical protein